MELLKIVAFGIVFSFLIIVTKQLKPEFSLLIIIAGSCVILMYLLQYIDIVIYDIDNIVAQTGINKELFIIILKIIGVGYLVEFGANICIDSGNQSIADKIILAGKVVILSVSMPVISNLLNTIIGLLKWDCF